MKANKYRQTYLEAYSEQNSIDPSITGSLLERCHKSIFKIIKNKGILLWAKELIDKNIEPIKEGVRLYSCTCHMETDRAIHLSIPIHMEVIKKWVPKSIIKPVKGIHVVPNWFIYQEDHQKPKKPVKTYDKEPHKKYTIESNYNESAPWL